MRTATVVVTMTGEAFQANPLGALAEVFQRLAVALTEGNATEIRTIAATDGVPCGTMVLIGD